MKRYFSMLLITAILVSFSQVLVAQTLFTIDGDAVTVAEFERVYTKNNINNQADYSKASLDEYLDLYVKFRLKVKEATVLQMDTLKPLQDELQMYRKQLAKNYLSDKNVTDGLVEEAYNRMQTEVDASHILIAWPSENPTPADSAKVLKEIKSVAKKANKSNFGELAKQYSNDPSAKDNAGRLGYLTVFQTVYPFESAMYETEIGKISSPVATRFGYHLVLVHDKRPARGKMTTAHILIKSKETDTPDAQGAAERTAQNIYKELNNGGISFEEAVKKYSEDKKTKLSSGVLPELGANEMMNSYAEVAFALEKDGDFAAPVKTSIGWHIVKRVSKKDLGSFEDLATEIGKKVERDSRSKVAETVMLEDTKQQFGYKHNSAAKTEIINALAKGYSNGKFQLSNMDSFNKSLFSIGTSSYSQLNFINYVEKYFQRTAKDPVMEPVLYGYYDKYETQLLTQYREDHLEEINVDFKNLMQEYHDGILLFELTNNEVWNKAVEDTAGLRKFHDANKDKYMWGERISYATYVIADAKTAAKVKKYLTKGWNSDQILAKSNKKEKLVSVNHEKFEQEATNLNTALKWEKGYSAQEIAEDGKVTIYQVEDILTPEPKLLKETRGYVISDYQDYLEKAWIADLQKKYSVQVNNEVLNSLIKK